MLSLSPDASIQTTVADGVALITLNRPEKLNSFHRTMALALQEVLRQCRHHPHVRALVITGAGKGFCAGQDLEEVLDPQGPGMNRILSEHYNPLVMQLRQMEKPVVAAVNGVAAGAGANLAFACDIVLAAEEASFIQAFSKIGLIPDSGGTYFLPRLIGWQKAMALMLLGDKLPAAEAEKMGAVYKVHPQATLLAEAMNTAARLAELPPQALALTKEALNRSLTNDYKTQLQLEDDLQQQAAATADFAEAVQAFVQKRKPVFTGK